MGSSIIFKRKFITFDSDTDSMRFSPEWFMIKDKGSICYCPILWYFMLVYEVNGVGGLYSVYVSLGQATPFIAKTSCPQLFVWNFQHTIDSLFRSIGTENVRCFMLQNVLCTQHSSSKVFVVGASVTSWWKYRTWRFRA